MDNNRKNSRKDNFDWQTSADSGLNASEWFGAIIRYLMSFGNGKFDDFYNQKEIKKNVLVGYLFTLVLLIILIICGIYYSMKE